MAENESLDRGNPGGQRWHQVHDAVRKGQSSEEIAKIAKRKLPAAFRKAFREFAELGVPFGQLVAARHDLKQLARLVRTIARPRDKLSLNWPVRVLKTCCV